MHAPQERKAVKAGQWGDAIFKHETVVRPDILLSIMGQGYKVLWTDVDIVWLGNPMPLLPDTQTNATAVSVLFFFCAFSPQLAPLGTRTPLWEVAAHHVVSIA